MAARHLLAAVLTLTTASGALAQEAAEFAIANEIDKLYKDMGGTAVNAHTWHEETVYKVSLPANRLLHWAVVESERFHDPGVLRSPVSEVVLERHEGHRREDDPP